jgi:hypothetical protein
MRSTLLLLAFGFLFGISSANACDGTGKACAKHTKGAKASASCMKDGKCTMKDAKAMKAGGACDMKAHAGMKAGQCDMHGTEMKASKTGVKSDKAETAKHSCCAPKAETKS